MRKPVIFCALITGLYVNINSSCKDNFNPLPIEIAGIYSVFAWNDLGMHCLNPIYNKLVILQHSVIKDPLADSGIMRLNFLEPLLIMTVPGVNPIPQTSLRNMEIQILKNQTGCNTCHTSAPTNTSGWQHAIS